MGGKLRHDIRSNRIKCHADLHEPGKKMTRGTQMNMHRNGRKADPGKMSAVIVEQILMAPGVQQPSSSKRSFGFVHVILRNKGRHRGASRRTI